MARLWPRTPYAYDAASRLTAETNAEGAVTYTYDDTDQLTGVGGARSEGYSYDLNGNRTLPGYVTGTGNRLEQAPGSTLIYDAEGNLTSRTETATGAVTTYAYDYRNRLTGVTRKNAGGTVLMQATYTYDAFDRRIGTVVDADGAGAAAPVQSWSAYDGVNPYADFDGAGTLKTRYLHGPAVDMLLARTDAAGVTAWYLTDRLGTVRDLADTAGAVIDHIAYDSFGRVTSETNPSAGDRFKFTGRELDAGTGLRYNRARYYDAAAGPLDTGGPDRIRRRRRQPLSLRRQFAGYVQGSIGVDRLVGWTRSHRRSAAICWRCRRRSPWCGVHRCPRANNVVKARWCGPDGSWGGHREGWI